jgi:hypothetical protein
MAPRNDSKAHNRDTSDMPTGKIPQLPLDDFPQGIQPPKDCVFHPDIFQKSFYD